MALNRMSKYLISIFILLFLGLILWGLRTNTTILPRPSAGVKPTETANTEVIASRLEVPWALAFLPKGEIIVTERSGTVKKIKDENITTIDTLPIKQVGEGGLHGVTLHPNFEQNNFFYFYYTYNASGDETLNKVVRFKFEDDKLTEERLIIDQIPGATFHDGGRIKFGPDRYLYITTGDAQNPSLAQEKNSLAGKILRVTDEGDPAPGNPFNNLVYSYGHRNPQGITWDEQGRLWEVEHGQSATDEINLIEPGKNYGWPEITGTQTKIGMETPILQSGSDTWAPGGATFYREVTSSAYNGSIYFGGLRGQALYQYVISTKELKTHFKGKFGRIREVVLGPDNMLYITTSNRDGRGNPSPDDDKIIKINPKALN